MFNRVGVQIRGTLHHTAVLLSFAKSIALNAASQATAADLTCIASAQEPNNDASWARWQSRHIPSKRSQILSEIDKSLRKKPKPTKTRDCNKRTLTSGQLALGDTDHVMSVFAQRFNAMSPIYNQACLTYYFIKDRCDMFQDRQSSP